MLKRVRNRSNLSCKRTDLVRMQKYEKSIICLFSRWCLLDFSIKHAIGWATIIAQTKRDGFMLRSANEKRRSQNTLRVSSARKKTFRRAEEMFLSPGGNLSFARKKCGRGVKIRNCFARNKFKCANFAF